LNTGRPFPDLRSRILCHMDRIERILEAGSHEAKPKAHRIEDPAGWTPERIRERAAPLSTGKGPGGNFDD